MAAPTMLQALGCCSEVLAKPSLALESDLSPQHKGKSFWVRSCRPAGVKSHFHIPTFSALSSYPFFHNQLYSAFHAASAL